MNASRSGLIVPSPRLMKTECEDGALRPLKRDRESSEAEELVRLLTQKLRLADDDAAVVDCFVSVLRCPREEALFFLESARGDLARAVDLCLETPRPPMLAPPPKQRRVSPEDPEVGLLGLPPGWRARVCAAGTVYLLADDSGEAHHRVPTDLEPALVAAADQCAELGLRTDLLEKVLALRETLDVSSAAARLSLECSDWDAARAASALLEESGGLEGEVLQVRGLPQGWAALMSRSSRMVLFRHRDSGYVQHQAPQGFP